MAAEAHLTVDLDALKKAYLDTPDEAVFLERAIILKEASERYAGLQPLTRQARIIAELFDRVTPVVNPADVFLGRVLEEVPSPAMSAFVEANPGFFGEPGVPGIVDSVGIYCPDWDRLLSRGIGGLTEEAALMRSEASGDHRMFLEAVEESLRAASRLVSRYAGEARHSAAHTADHEAERRFRRLAECCDRIALASPESFHDALQLFVLYHMMLACLVGARNVTTGRMDQYLLPLYRADVENGVLTRREAVDLLAAAMVMLSQGSGRQSVDFQSTKRTPPKHSHYYVTIGGTAPDGACLANDLSFAMLDAASRAGLREPSIEVRWSPNIDKRLWREALSRAREGRPVLFFNDAVVTAALMREGVPREAAFDYVHAGCVNVLLPGRGQATLRDSVNVPLLILAAINGGRHPSTNEVLCPGLPPASGLSTFEGFFGAVRAVIRAELARKVAWYETIDRRLPLLALPLFEGRLAGGYDYRDGGGTLWDVHVTGVATAIDCLLGVRATVYDRRRETLEELVSALRDNYKGHDSLRRFIVKSAPHYGSDDAEVLGMIDVFGRLWVEEVEAASRASQRVRLRPGFHSWLFNIEDGAGTPATPDGRLAGEHLSSDFLPSGGHGRLPMAVLRCVASLPHATAPSGGTTFALDASHFEGERGLDRLSGLIEGYFAEGGIEIHFIFSDLAALEDAVAHPERHKDLLVRVTGFSEYFVRLAPEVQKDIILRAGGRESA